ncbi:hypothetical protein GOV11_03805 [Candidatus Woesearchaeota archaeon]|nr:hypothetical protein [Candidatus Woesearchaeota archaeon]
MNRVKTFLETHQRSLLVLAALILTIVFTLSGTQLYLKAQLMLGNDVIISMTLDNQEFSIQNGQVANVTMETSVITNPFCSAKCVATFEDVSEDRLIDQRTFEIRPGKPYSQTYHMTPDSSGEGQILYRISMECQGIKRALCQTNMNLEMRSALITLDHTLNSDERTAQETLRMKLINIHNTNSIITSSLPSMQALADSLGATAEKELSTIYETEIMLERVKPLIEEADAQWSRQDYTNLAETVIRLDRTLSTATILSANETLHELAEAHNAVAALMQKSYENLEAISKLSLLEDNRSNGATSTYLEMVEIFYKGNDPVKKKYILESLSGELDSLREKADKILLNETVRVLVETDISKSALCTVRGICLSHPTGYARAVQDSLNIDSACSDLELFLAVHTGISTSISGEITNEGYPSNSSFWDKIELIANNIFLDASKSYGEDIPNSPMGSLIKSFLPDGELADVQLDGYNLTPALTRELINRQPTSCGAADQTIPPPPNTTLIDIPDTPQKQEVKLPDQNPTCCIHGSCAACCEDCSGAPFPIIFLHGHAFNKDTSAEYSLDAFNSIQSSLENDGYLDAGMISVSNPSGWARADIPITVKASYYFDAFEEQGEYVVVHTKSESINTYATRLKDIVDTVKERSDEDKVIIIAHSMGGLVARRYDQLWPGNIDKIIMVGTPNHGVSGGVSELCPLIGSPMECDDMKEGSIFLNKLNSATTEASKIVIYGAGCDMEGSDGDGVVTVESAVLSGAQNIEISGKCTTLEKLHTSMLHVDKYPDVYRQIIISLGDVS